MKKRILSLCVALSFALTLCLPASAKSITSPSEQILLECSDELDKIELVYREEKNGDRVFIQYVNNRLTEEAIIPYGNHEIILVKDYDYVTRNLVSQNIIQISDYIQPTGYQSQAVVQKASSVLGNIHYKTILPSGISLFYSLNASYTIEDSGQGTYTINGFYGTLATLVALLVSALALPEAIAATYVRRLLVSAGITAGSAGLSAVLTTTVSANYTIYQMKIQDNANSSVWKYVPGAKYVVNDTRYHTGETYYEGYCPQDWGSRGRRFKSCHSDHRKTLKPQWFQGFFFSLSLGKIRSKTQKAHKKAHNLQRQGLKSIDTPKRNGVYQWQVSEKTKEMAR